MIKAARKTTTKKSRAGRALRSRGRRDREAENLPSLPVPDARGNVDALEYLRASIARDLVKRRRECGLSQQALAEMAKVRQETVSRIESAKHTVTRKVLNKLMRAFERA